MKSKYLTTAIFGLLVATVLLLPVQPILAKSLYVNKDLNVGSPISAYDVQAAPSYLVWQQTSSPTHYGGAGLAIDTDSETLFVTFEGYGALDIVNASTLEVLDHVVAPNAINLAGIAVDQDNQKVYTVDRNTDRLYVYSWDATTYTLTNDITTPPYYVALPGLAGAYGLALDEFNDLLYVADNSMLVKYYKTGDWSLAGTIPMVTQTPMAVAVDVDAGWLYTGNAYPGYGCTGHLVKTDLDNWAETTVDIRKFSDSLSNDCVVGIAVDPLTSLVYITTGNQGSGGSDRIIVLDSSLTPLYFTGDIGNPTGIVVPGKEISYNPLNLMKQDGFAEDECAFSGATLTYAVCYDNALNDYAVDNVVVEDTLPLEVSFVSATDGGVYNFDRKVSWNIGTLPAGSSEECVYVKVILNAGPQIESTFTNAANIASDQTPMTTQNESTQVCANSPPVADPNGPYEGNEGTDIVLDATGSYDPDNDALTYLWTVDGSPLCDDLTLATPTCVWPDNDVYNVCVTVNDGQADSEQICTTATINNLPPVLGSLQGPSDPFSIGTPITIGGAFTDPGIADTHTTFCDWGDLVSSTATVVESFGAGQIESSHSYYHAGVYTIVCTVTDDDGDSDTEFFQFAVIFDPSVGFVTGGGWIDSPVGAYIPDPTLTGRATFGFVSKYKKGRTTPEGSTEFQFHAGDLNFHSNTYDWLVLAGPKAMYKGVGTVNGAGNFGFLLKAIDAKLTPNTDVDLFSIMIWDKDLGDLMLYDNGLGDVMDENPTQQIGNGQIVIHMK
jgi:uncharacterized repeat protein (TIGR01451 family)